MDKSITVAQTSTPPPPRCLLTLSGVLCPLMIQPRVHQKSLLFHLSIKPLKNLSSVSSLPNLDYSACVSCTVVVVFHPSLPQPCLWVLSILYFWKLLATSKVLHPSERLFFFFSFFCFTIFELSVSFMSLFWTILPEVKKLPNNSAHFDMRCSAFWATLHK